MNDLVKTLDSPFDDLRQVRADGSELWSARDLQSILGYDQWRRFEESVLRAAAAISNSGGTASDHIAGAGKKVRIGSGTVREVADYQLTRYGAYMVAMNGDPRKAEIAAAQTYFAVKTREAEVQPQSFNPASLSRMDILRMAMEAEEKLQIAAPKAEAYDKFMDADGLYSMEAAAKAIGYGRNVMFRELRRIGILQGNNLPYQRYMHHFEIKVGTRTTRSGETVPTYTTMVRPSGVQFIGNKLARAAQAVEEAGLLPADP